MAVPGYCARVVDENGNDVPAGTISRLAVQGPTGCRYLGHPRQANYVKGGWNYTGDACLQDTDGYFFYQSRTDDMIISAGYNIAAVKVEDVLLSHEAVAECAVIGHPDEERGQIVKAFVVLRSSHQGDEVMVNAAGLREGERWRRTSTRGRWSSGKCCRGRRREAAEV